MGVKPKRPTWRYWPQVLLATGLIALAPIALVWALSDSRAIGSMPLLMAIGILTSLLLSQVGIAIWVRRPGGVDLLFGELMVWGWLRRLWSERRLASAARMLGHAGASRDLDPREQAERLERLSAALEASDPYTHGHSRRVARHSAAIAKRLRLRPAQVARVRTAAAVHDVGKIRTPPEVLRKRGKLTREEFALIERHAADGAEMVSTLDDRELTRAVLHHHERFDGTGYPDRLSGERIPLDARIIAVADTFDAVASTRPYRRASSHRDALDVLARESGSQLDPTAVRAFLNHYRDSRPLALWAVLASVPERIVALLGGGANAASAAVASVAVAVAAVTAIGPPAVDTSTGPDSNPAREATVASASSSGEARWGSERSFRNGGNRRGRATKPAAGAAPAVTTPAAELTSAAAASPVATVVGGTPSAPAAAAQPGGGAASSGPGEDPPASGSAPPGPQPVQPPADPPADEGPSGVHLLPHLPVGPHLPHVPGFED